LQGSHNIHGNLNLANISGSLAPRNNSMAGIPSPGFQQPGGGISSGRFPSNNLQASMSQVFFLGIHSLFLFTLSGIFVASVLISLGPFFRFLMGILGSATEEV